MPKFLEDILKKSAHKKGLKGKEVNHYIFGAMNNIGAVHGSKITPKGERMQEKHDKDMQTESHTYDWRRKRQHRAKNS